MTILTLNYSKTLLTGALTIALSVSVLPVSESHAFWGKKPKLSKAQTMENALKVQSWRSLQGAETATSTLQFVKDYPGITWWEVFQDPHLNSLIQKALAKNPSLMVIQKQVDESKAQSMILRAPLLPQASVGASYLCQQYGKNQFVFPLQGRTFHSFQIPLSVSYELDLAGRNWKTYQAGKQGVVTATHEYQNALIQLSSTIASAYFNVLRLDALIELQVQQLKLAEQDAQHTQRWFDKGQLPQDNVEDKRQLVEALQAELDALKGSQAVAIHQLLILTGDSPSQVEQLTRTSLSTIALPKSAPSGVPSELIVHRPDVQRVESALKAAAINISVARRNFLPVVQLNAQTGPNAIGIANLFKWNSLNSFLYPTISQSLFSGGSKVGALRLRKAQYEQLLHTYMETMLQAFGDVENALSMLVANQSIYQNVYEQYQTAEKRAFLEKQRFDAGISAQPAFIGVETRRLEFQKALYQQKAQLLTDHVSLMKALGGGFHNQS
jgi:NodT family efflux transporter outer membrane factor (OMF) lipoprotein